MIAGRDKLKIAFICGLIAAITMLHFAPLASQLGTHLLHRELYFFPILLAGFWYGLVGGVVTATIVSFVYTVQFAFSGILDEVMTAVGSQVLVFLAVGLFLGGMVDRQERRRRERDLIRTRLAEERMQQREMKIQLETATKIQSLFQPKLPQLGSGSHVWGFSRPAKFVGGDLYDVIPMPDKSWLLYVADVSDKGLPAALIMAALWYQIHSEAHLHEDVGQLLTSLNKPLYDLVSEEGYFVTIFIGRYWPREGRLEFANGGHLPAMKTGPRGWSRIDGKRGMSLGAVEDSTYETQTEFIDEGEAVFFMTDGITEALNHDGARDGLAQIFACLQAAQGPPWGRRLLAHIDKAENATDQSDDLTLLEIWREANGSHISPRARKVT